MIFPQVVENSEFSEFFWIFFRRELKFREVFAGCFCIPREFSTGVGMFFWIASQPRSVGVRGRETPIFPVGKVAIWIAKQDKFMAALRWFSPPKRNKNKLMAVLRCFLPRESKCIIDRVIKFKYQLSIGLT